MEPEIIYETQTGLFWDWRVALDLYLGGAGVGALLFAIIMDEVFRGKYRRICQTAAYLAPLLILLGLVFLLLKLGHPQRLLLVYLNFNPNSPLWWGGIFQPLLILGAVVYAFTWWQAQAQPEMQRPFRQWLGRFLFPLGAIVGAYHGLLLAVINARPLWNTGPTVVAAILGYITTGIAAVLVVHLIRMNFGGRLENEAHVNEFLDRMNWVRNLLTGALFLQVATYFFWWLALSYGDLTEREALAAANAAYGPMFWLLGIGLGVALPLLIGGYAVWRGEKNNRRLQLSIILTTSIMILIGGFFYRLSTVLGGQVDLPVRVF